MKGENMTFTLTQETAQEMFELLMEAKLADPSRDQMGEAWHRAVDDLLIKNFKPM